MSLKLLQPGIQPLGQFDGYDADFLTTKGGEICTLASVLTPGQPGVFSAGYDKAAYDAFDGYVNPSSVAKRPVVTRTFSGTGALPGASGTSRPLMLTDDGILGYGTLFGAVVGGTVGQQVNGPLTYTGAILGPHTATGSGKITCWDKQGLYAVSLDACDTAVSTGLQPTNTSLDVGAAVTFSGTGLLTPTATTTIPLASAPNVARLAEFATNGALVNTPNYLVAALNSPSGNVSSVGPRSFQYAVIFFNPPSF
jgi:hypothetical protein